MVSSTTEQNGFVPKLSRAWLQLCKCRSCFLSLRLGHATPRGHRTSQWQKTEIERGLCSSCNYSTRCCCYLFISVYTSTIFDLFLTLHQLQVPWHMDYGDAVGTASSALLACYEVRAGNQSLKQNAIWRSGSASRRFLPRLLMGVYDSLLYSGRAS